MKTTFIAAITLLAAMGVMSADTVAEAAAAPPVAVAKKPTPGQPDGGQTYEPGQPFHPAGPCVPGLGHLPDLTTADIGGITDGHALKVLALCKTFSLADQRDVGKEGNVDGLIGWIDRNPVIRGKLVAKGFRPLDVVAIVFGADGSTFVYAHKR